MDNLIKFNGGGGYKNVTYLLLDYIQTSGVQYVRINLDGNTSNKLKITLDAQYTNLSDSANGYYVASTFYFLMGISSGNFMFQFGKGGSEVSVTTANTDRNTFVLDGANGKCYVGEISSSITVSQYNLTTFTLGCRVDSSSTKSKHTSAKYYSCQVEYENVLIRDLVPAIRYSDLTVGMYDKVNDVFYAGYITNGAFIKGNIIGKI